MDFYLFKTTLLDCNIIQTKNYFQNFIEIDNKVVMDFFYKKKIMNRSHYEN